MTVQLLVAVALLLSACSETSPTPGATVIDRASVGDRRCAGVQQDPWEATQCGRFQGFAAWIFARVRPGHAQVAAVEVYRDPDYEDHLKTFSGFVNFAYVVMRQPDGTATALHIRAGAGTNANICFLLPPYGDGTSHGDCPGPDPE